MAQMVATVIMAVKMRKEALTDLHITAGIKPGEYLVNCNPELLFLLIMAMYAGLEMKEVLQMKLPGQLLLRNQ
ncbi:hypothetical protein D3C84_715950 [compost metagenome]